MFFKKNVLFFAQSIDDLSDFRGEYTPHERTRTKRGERRASGAEPGEYLSGFILTFTFNC